MLKISFIGVFAGVFEEICQINFVSAVGISRKTNGFDQGFVFAFSIKIGVMHTAKVDKVQRGASHDEHWLKFVGVRNGGKVHDATAVSAHRELTDASQFSVHQRLIRKHFRAKWDLAACAKGFLLLLVLNR